MEAACTNVHHVHHVHQPWDTHTHIDRARVRAHHEGDLFIYLFSYTYRRVRVRERLERGRVCVSHTPWCVVHIAFLVHIGRVSEERKTEASC